ncbi:MAG: oligoribonuclease [Microbacteriaceae bacterium]|nr:oligoribonuclease [Microbacteriaceae bacterium]
MANASNPLLVWIDCEMTGLDPAVDELVEVAVVVTDYDLNPVDDGFQVVIKPSSAARDQMSDFVREMHVSSGLLDELDDGLTLDEAGRQILEYLHRFVPEAGSAPLAGNTIGTDRMFIQKYLPEVNAYLHYRNIDVSTIKELSKQWFPKSYYQSPEKNGGHRALADILESIRELAYYRRAVFLEAPGLETKQLKAVSEAIAEQWAPRL